MSTTRAIRRIVIHCAATPNGDSLFRAGKSPADVIDDWHRARGFRRRQDFRRRQNSLLGHLGYHFLIYTNGAVVTGRHLDEIGAHAKGHNADSIAICMIGTDKFTRAQWASLAANVGGLLRRYPKAEVCGHRDLSPDTDGDGVVEPHEWLKTCPGFDVSAWLAAGMAPPAEHLLEG